MSDLYYTAPSNEIFEEVRNKAIELWIRNYPENDHPYYAKEKVKQIKNLKNISNNFMYIIAMFDEDNKLLISSQLSKEAKKEINKRIIDGGGNDNIFN